MQKFILGSALTLLFGITGCNQTPSAQPANSAADTSNLVTNSTAAVENTAFISVSVADFEKKIAEEGVQLIDVRTAKEYADGHIKGSINLDSGAEDFVAKANESLDKTQPVAIYCRSGRRSKEAAKVLAKEGFKITELDHGFNSWKEAEREIEK